MTDKFLPFPDWSIHALMKPPFESVVFCLRSILVASSHRVASPKKEGKCPGRLVALVSSEPEAISRLSKNPSESESSRPSSDTDTEKFCSTKFPLPSVTPTVSGKDETLSRSKGNKVLSVPFDSSSKTPLLVGWV